VGVRGGLRAGRRGGFEDRIEVFGRKMWAREEGLKNIVKL
jgi:hypothetical protein